MNMRHQLADLLNIPRLQSALDSLYIASKIPSAVIDNEGIIHTGSGWQDICTKFHRVHPEARKRCIESDLYITGHIQEANPSITYKCPHGLVDSATPIFIEGEHIGNVFTGQLFLEEPDLDHFRAQAKAFGFDEEIYLDAVKKVPIITEQALQKNLAFVAHLTGMLAEMGLKRAREMEAEKRLRESEERYRAVVDGLPDVVMRFDRDGRHLFVSDNVSRVVDLPAAQFIGKTHSELGFPETQIRFWEEAIRGVFDSGAPYETEFTLEGNQGPVIFNWRLVPERDAQGIVRSVLSFKRDITDHRRAEEKLLQSEKKVLESQYLLQAVVDGTTDAIFVKDLQGRYRLFNNAASSYTRKTMVEVIGNDDTTLFSADEARAIMEGDRGVIASGKTSTYEEHLTTTRGKKVTFLSTKGPMFDECGNVNGLFGISRDITGQKQAEESLRESEAKYRSLFEHMQEGCAYCKMIFVNGDPVDFIYVSVNAAFEALTGLKDVVGKRVSEVIPGIRSSDPSMFETYGRVARTGKPEKVEIFVEALQQWFSISAYSPDQGYFVAVFDIITDRKRSEEVARREISLRNVLLDNLPCIALIMKKQTREIVACNDLAKKYGAVIGKSCYDTLGVPDSPCPFCLAPEIWETGESNQVEVEYMGKFWHGIWVPFSEDLFVHYIFEITDRKRAEAEKEKLQAQLQQAMKMEAIGRLAGGVAHDFNNLLTVITGYSELMLQRLGEESPMHGQVEEIKRAGERAASLTQQLLAFSRKQIIEPKVLQLDSLVAEMHKMLTRLIGEDIELHAATGKSLGSVKVDPGQFHQILMNLVVNARDAMPGGGKITIETVERGPGRRVLCTAPVRHPRPVRDAVGKRHGERDERRGQGAHLRAVLHHEGARKRNGAGPCDDLRDSEAGGRLHRGVLGGRDRDDLQDLPPAGRGGGRETGERRPADGPPGRDGDGSPGGGRGHRAGPGRPGSWSGWGTRCCRPGMGPRRSRWRRDTASGSTCC